MSMKVDIWHNITWSRYKAGVFNELYRQTKDGPSRFRIFQIAETESGRSELAAVDYSVHKYPFTLLFEGPYESVPRQRLYRRTASLVAATDADMVVLAGYHRPEYWLQLVIGRLRGMAMGVFCDSTGRDKPKSLLRTLLKRLFFANVQAVFCYGSRSRDYLMKHGVKPSVIFIRCQAAELSSQYSAADSIEARVKQADPNRQRFLYVGRLAKEKSLDTLVEAFAKHRRVHPDAELHLVGTGPEQEPLRHLCESQAVADAVHFAGAQSGETLAQAYREASCLILPSLSEPWGLVVNEALSFGCPAIVSDNVGCGPELIFDGRTGLVFKTGDVDDLAGCLERASGAFGAIRETAVHCVALIGEYTPQRAAEAIVAGCEATLQKRRSTPVTEPATHSR
jgi:glycosyltransferase involved in cell wall biosynthesis